MADNTSDVLHKLYATLAFTGHRPQDLPSQFGFDPSYSNNAWRSVIDKIKSGIKYYNTNKIITGGAIGLDQAAALAGMELKDEGYPLTLQLDMPFEGQDSLWNPGFRDTFNKIRQGSDVVNVLGNKADGIGAAMMNRNRHMVDNADALMALWNGKESGGTYNTIEYALNDADIPVINIYNSIMKNLK